MSINRTIHHQNAQVLVCPQRLRYARSRFPEKVGMSRVLSLLETRPQQEECTGLWRRAGDLALTQHQLSVAAVCFGAAGDPAKAAFIREVRAPTHASLPPLHFAIIETHDSPDKPYGPLLCALHFSHSHDSPSHMNV